ncbi:MAG: thioredoxin-disulfide reductase [Dehalococcoidia bacterium]|nr:thioredoxin-disulfide reductase [Dehalococcoidia bacterium]MDZ4245601.1 thioredoxin-disulfide reductase [Dehalococcoidia bacterium]
MNDKYELIIIGGGPAGLTAGIYAAMARLKTLLIEKMTLGGRILFASKVENFPGFPDGISGGELAELMYKQATKFGLEIHYAGVEEIKYREKRNVVKTGDGSFEASSIILAGGCEHTELGVPGEGEFIGKGVSYCATCDANFFQERVVAVVGGGNAAVSEALYLTNFASRVILIHRRNELRASPILQERLLADPKITVIWDSVVKKVQGQKFLEELELGNVKTGKITRLKVAGVFVAIGFKPNTDYLRDILELDKLGQVVTNTLLATSQPGIYAAGDIRSNSGRQAIIAAGDGAASAIFANNFLRGL